ncbi:hypothetical protein SAMN05216578_10855 [Halopseudomonas formosensis]|uniref:Uncharacterized protein n=1 Tax=Halopseudomonas formosensis TaxID=1002526 RepID=A0A1I6BY48_9GAMM|nr:hypothetical protein [Halopseudomonas formosensis]SFQ85861.1 hypothetical protein SAMN05216578_10855 [Halopseudomonas formosensis]
MTKKCSACEQNTLLDSAGIEKSAITLAALDSALRKYHQYILGKQLDDQVWSGLNTLLDALPAALTGLEAGQAQGKRLANSINRSWLGSFESLCLTCGLLFLPDMEE